jgi:tetratricopeptide (TPR) repeat protein
MTAATEALRVAAGLAQQGRLDEAIPAYRRVLEHSPGLPDAWYDLGLLERRAGRFEAALECYAQALRHGASRPEEVHLNRGVILADWLHRPAQAERELDAALALNPRFIPALQNLANLHEDLGRRDQASAVYRRILELDPGNLDSLARYVGLMPITRPDDPLIARLEAAIADAGTSAAARATLGFALGAALDSCAEYARAFAAYQAANRDSRASAPGVPRYDRLAHERYVDELIRAFPQPPQPRASSKAPAPALRPVFICGMFRSGSTLVEQLLARHPQVRAGGELDLLPRLAHTELAPFPASLASLQEPRLGQIAERYRRELADRCPGATFVTDKRPDNFLLIGLIKRLFPEARIVHTTRDPLDNCLSIFFLHLDQRLGYALDLLDIGHYFRQYRRLMGHWHALYGDELLEFNYDSLVNDPRPAVARLLDFCGLDWHDECLTPAPEGGAVRTASVWQVREPIYRRSSGRARHYSRELAPLAACLAQP